MFVSTYKRFILPFSNQKSNSPEAEEAAVFAVAELERNKGGGLIARQREEKLVFISKSGYPLWLFPKNDGILVFDGFADSSFTVSYAEIPPTKAFKEDFETNSRPREKYSTFLSSQSNYFQRSVKEKNFLFRGLIADSDLKDELNVYRKEITEGNAQTIVTLLLPTLDETAIAFMLSEFDKVQTRLREEAEMLPECIRLINKATSQYITEINYETEAAKEETEAKIKAQEELVNPQISGLNRKYNHKIKELAESFDKELESLKKLGIKTQKSIESNEEEIKLCQDKARVQASKKHSIYEKRWKQKIKQIEKEVKNLKKDLRNIEENLRNISKQKAQEISEINFELDAKIKWARKPIAELEAARDAKMLTFKLETEKMFKLEKPVIESLNRSINLSGASKASFEGLYMRGQDLKSPALFYVPFYVACYEMGLTRRYIIVPPSTITDIDFSTRLKGALGRSKLKDLFTPRFKAISDLVGTVQGLTKQNSLFENQLYDLGQKNNFLKNSTYSESIQKGLVYLNHQGWLSDKEQQVLSNRLLA
jgi:hypothetical protein